MSKNIVVCSDGTGQKGGYGSDSNVYKLYKMVDLHSASAPQITFYDNGVGTSESDSESKANKLQEAISGGFGFGFAENVCDLYGFLAKNYDAGDNIYFFGFSRGASTVRACVGFLHHCGLLDKNQTATDQEFDDRMDKAFKAYQQCRKNPKLAAEFKANHAVQNTKFAPEGDLKIHFVGVWDTVSALGFSTDWTLLLDPILKALDNLSDDVFPHRFYDYELNKQISYAYHALSIDDARKTFRPKVWDESKGNVVEQVWFPGVHSNVGGGYQRTGLADVAFDWMLTRAEQQGLVFLADDRVSVKAHANSNGKLYDSRDGMGMYYRYQPRNLLERCKNVAPVRIHDSTIERMKRATANYAPSYIPAEFELVTTNLKTTSKTVRIADADKAEWQAAGKEVDAWVGKRKLLYHVFMELSVFLLVISGLFWKYPPESVLTDLRNACAACGEKPGNGLDLSLWIYDFLHYITPVFFENFLIYTVKLHFFIFVALVAAAYVLSKIKKNILVNLQVSLEKLRTLVLKNC